MSTYKHNCTKGPVKWKGRMLIGNERHDGSALLGTVICNEGEHFPKDDERAANAELIAEAFNVLHETGMTPRELVERLRAIHGGLSSCETENELRQTVEMCMVQSNLTP